LGACCGFAGSVAQRFVKFFAGFFVVGFVVAVFVVAVFVVAVFVVATFFVAIFFVAAAPASVFLLVFLLDFLLIFLPSGPRPVLARIFT
jgi:hypothetical protein